MRREDCFELGFISKVHGYKGELFFIINEGIRIELNEMESLFIEINGQMIPFFIDACRETGNSAWKVKLHDVETEEKARQLVNCSIFLLLSMLPKKDKKKLEPFALNGYKVIDDVKGEIGSVAKVLEMPQQLILEIRFGSKEILIPANEEIIYKIDHKNKIIFLNSPEGLIDIYIGEKD